MRQGILTEYDPPRGVSISTLAYDYPAGFRVAEHAHGSDQLIYATGGLMEISAGRSLWLIPPHFAVWIPARTSHSIGMRGTVSMRTLYLRPGLAKGLPDHCRVIHVTPLLRELVLEAVRAGRLRASARDHRALRDLLLSQLKRASAVPTGVTLPRDSRALAVAQALLSDPAGRQSLRALCARAGAGVRSVERAFRRDTGIGFVIWRRQVRLMKAIELLLRGGLVKEAACAAGYRQTSAFVEMFRATLGSTPKAWISGLGPTGNSRGDAAGSGSTAQALSPSSSGCQTFSGTSYGAR